MNLSKLSDQDLAKLKRQVEAEIGLRGYRPTTKRYDNMMYKFSANGWANGKSPYGLIRKEQVEYIIEHMDQQKEYEVARYEDGIIHFLDIDDSVVHARFNPIEESPKFYHFHFTPAFVDYMTLKLAGIEQI